MAHHFTARLAFTGCLVLALVSLAGCGEPEPPAAAAVVVAPEQIERVETTIERQRAEKLASLSTAVSILDVAIEEFLVTPDEVQRTRLQAAWRSAHLKFRGASLFPPLAQDDALPLRFEIDAWPIEPGFLDSLPLYPESGIINDPTLRIDEATLIAQHGITDPSEVSLGFHAIEYYAFDRPLADLADNGEPNARRRAALAIMSAQLRRSIAMLTDAPGPLTDTGRTPGRRLFDLLDAFRDAIVRGFTEATLIIDTDAGHSSVSQSSIDGVREQFAVLPDIFGEDTEMMSLLKQVDPVVSHELAETLQLAAATMAAPELDRSRLPLMLAAVNRQLQALQQRLPGEVSPMGDELPDN